MPIPPHQAAALALSAIERGVVPSRGGGPERGAVASVVGTPDMPVSTLPKPALHPIRGKKGRPSFLATPLSLIMKSNGHTNPQLAKYLGIGLRTVENWTTGAKEIPEDQVAKLCALYNRSPQFFTPFDPEMDDVDEESYRIAEEFFTR